MFYYDDMEEGGILCKQTDLVNQGNMIFIIWLELFCYSQQGLEPCACPLEYIKRVKGTPLVTTHIQQPNTW